MFKLVLTNEFLDWLDNLRDRVARMRISARLVRAELGNLGDFKSVAGGLHEMRLDFGPAIDSIFSKERRFWCWYCVVGINHHKHAILPEQGCWRLIFVTIQIGILMRRSENESQSIPT